MSRSDQGGKLYRRRRGCLKLWKGKIALVGIRRQGSFGKIWGTLEKIDAPWPLRYESRAMSRYIARKCPKCRDDFGVAVHHPTPKAESFPSRAFAQCAATS